MMLVGLCWVGIVSGQQQFMVSLTERAFQVIPTSNKGFYTLTHQVNCPDDHVVVRYFSRNGVMQSEVRSPVYLGLISSMVAATLENSNLVLYLRDGSINHMMYGFDSTGNQLWNKNFQVTAPVLVYKKVLPIPGGGFYLMGNYDINTINDSAKAVLTRCDAVGQPLWTKQYSMADASPSYVKWNDIQWVQGQIMVAGYHYRSGNVVGWAPKRPTWLRLDTAGNPTQQATYYMIDSSMIGFDEYEFMRLESTPAGQYQALVYNSGNEHALIRFDNQMNVRWIKEKLSGRVQAFAVGYNDEIFLVPDFVTGNMIVGLDSNGAFLSARRTPYSSAFNDNSVYGAVKGIQRYDCGFLVVNDKTLLAHTRASMAYCSDSTFTYNPSYYTVTNHARKGVNIQVQPFPAVNVYGSTGLYTAQSSSPQTWCSVAYSCAGATAVHEQEDDWGIHVYPSSYQEMYTISLPNTAPWRLQVYNLLGQRVDERVLQGSLRYNVAGRYGANGTYLLRLQRGEQVFRTRIECIR